MAKLLEHKSVSETRPHEPNLHIRILENRSYSMWICNYPTLNCQLFSLGNAQFLINRKRYDETKLEDILLTIKNITSKSLMLVDLNAHNLKAFKEDLKEYIDKTIDTPYVSTNNSSMIISLVYLNDKYRELEETKEPEKTKVPSKKDPSVVVSPAARMRSMLDQNSW